MADIQIIKGDQIFADVLSVECFESKADIEASKAKKFFSLSEMEALGRSVNADATQAEQTTAIAFSNHVDNDKLLRDRIGICVGEDYTDSAKKQYLLVKCNFNIVLHKSGGIFGSWFSGNGTSYPVTKDLWIKLDHVTNFAGVSVAERQALEDAERKRLVAAQLTPKTPSAPAPDGTKTIFGLVVGATLLGGGYLLYNNNQKKKALVKQASLGIVSDNITERKKLN